MNAHQKFVVTVCAAVTLLFLTFTLLLVLRGERFQPELPGFSFGESPYRWVETVLDRNLPGRGLAAALRVRAELLIGQECVDGIYSRDGVLIEKLAPPAPDASAAIAEDVRAFAAASSSQVYFMAVPTAYEFIQNRFPLCTPEWSQRVYTKELVGQLAGYVRELDIYAELANADNSDVWFRTETLWTAESAYIGYRSFAAATGLYPQPLNKFNLEVVSYDFSGALRRALYGAAGDPDRIDLYYDPHTPDAASIERYTAVGTETPGSVYAREWLSSERQDNVFLGEDCALTRIRTVVANERKLLVIGDGFADVICPFFLRNYGQIDLVKLPMLTEETAALVRQEEYSAVLMVFGVDTLTDPDCTDALSLLIPAEE